MAWQSYAGLGLSFQTGCRRNYTYNAIARLNGASFLNKWVPCVMLLELAYLSCPCGHPLISGLCLGAPVSPVAVHSQPKS